MKEILLLLICCGESGMPIWCAGTCGEKIKLGWFGTGVWYVCVGVWLGVTYYQRTLVMYSRAYLILEIFVTALLTVWRFRIKWGGAFLIISILYESICMIDLLMLMSVGYYYGIETLRWIQRGINYREIAFCMISRLLVSVGLYLIYKRRREVLSLYKRNRSILFFIPIVQYLSMFIGEYFFYYNQKIIALRSVFILLFACICIIFLFAVQYTRERGEYERTILEERAYAAELRYRVRLKDDRERDILVHDIQNHLIVLNGILRKSSTDRALDYIEKVQENYRAIKQSVETGNIVVDTILGSKVDRAEEAGISIKILADSLSDTFVEDKDWCSILANLLDNAIEACNGLDEERWIKIRLENKPVGILLNVENSCRKKETEELGHLETTKKDKEKHGIGLQSVSYAIEKYGGMLIYKRKGTVFSVNVIFYR